MLFRSCNSKPDSVITGFFTQSVGSFSDYLSKLKVCVDYLKGRSTIGEMDMLPNRFNHTLYYKNYQHQLYLSKNPKQAEAEATNEALGQLGGMM